MLKTILRKEHKNDWEKRTPLTPDSVSNLIKLGYPLDVETSNIRIFDDTSYQNSAATLVNSPDEHQLVIGIKEPPIDSIKDQQVHLCFSHTIKGQDYNMPLLQRFLVHKASLIDYELMTDENGIRTIAFGEHAGIAGAVDSLWIAGQKFRSAGKISPLSNIKQTVYYKTINRLKAEFSNITFNSQDDPSSAPVQLVIIGTGNVGRGAEKVCQWLGLNKLDPRDFTSNKIPKGDWYTVLSSRHLHQRLTGGDFDQVEYMTKGKQAYKSILSSFLGRFNILLQTSFWTDFYPRHLDNKQCIEFKDKLPLVLGDISCDIEGSFACTKLASTIDSPAFTYLADSDSVVEGISEEGITVMSIDNLPCELSLDASEHFSAKLEGYTPLLMKMDLNQSFDELELPSELKKAVIVYKGELTEKFAYLKEFL